MLKRKLKYSKNLENKNINEKKESLQTPEINVTDDAIAQTSQKSKQYK